MFPGKLEAKTPVFFVQLDRLRCPSLSLAVEASHFLSVLSLTFFNTTEADRVIKLDIVNRVATLLVFRMKAEQPRDAPLYFIQ